MNRERHQRAMAIFAAACELPAGERAALIARECGDDADLRGEVEALLSFDDANDDLDDTRLGAGAVQTALEGAAWARPDRIGPYRILSVLGRGGMGMVYEAQQDQPLRVVALKVIAPEVTSPHMRRRFEHEAELLGRLQHPGIAQIFAAGTAPADQGGQPFFAMELVKGQPITDFVRARALSLRATLELLVKVCEAVDYAHHRGVIHRDLKPGNVLVTDEGQPKVLDFGVARTIDDASRGASLRTGVGNVVGTLAYMSPEQAVGDGGEVDIRTDVYALGVIAYELLTGKLPLDLSGKSVPEALRTVVEREPPSLATQRRDLRGDLDTIVGKAMRKLRDARYPSAGDLAADLRRYLDDQPIVARAPSALYTLGKFARRHRGLLVAVALLFASIVAGLVVSVLLYLDAARERVRADERAAEARQQARVAQAVTDFLTEVLEQADPATNPLANQQPLRELVAQAASRSAQRSFGSLEQERAVRRALGQALSGLGAYVEAERELRAALATLEGAPQHVAERATLRSQLARVLTDRGDHAQGETLARAAIEELTAANERSGLDTVYHTLGAALHRAEKWDEAEAAFSTALELRQREGLAETTTMASTLASRGAVRVAKEDFESAERDLREALGILTKTAGPNTTETLTARNNLASLHLLRGELDRAEVELRAVADAELAVYGADHPARIETLGNIAVVQARRRDYANAETTLRESIRISEGDGTDQGLRLANSLCSLAYVRKARGALREAEALYVRALGLRDKAAPDPSLTTASFYGDLARVRSDLGDLPGEIEALQRSLDNSMAVEGPSKPNVVLNRIHLAGRLFDAKRHTEVLDQLSTAEAAAIKVIEAKHPSHGERLRLRALALHALTRPEEAKAAAADYVAWCRAHLSPESAQAQGAARLLDDAPR